MMQPPPDQNNSDVPEGRGLNTTRGTAPHAHRRPLRIAVYGSAKKFAQSFAPFINFCATCPDRVHPIVHVLSISEAVPPDAAVPSPVDVMPPLCGDDDAAGNVVDVLFVKLSSAQPHVRTALGEWVCAVEAKRVAAASPNQHRPLVVIEPLHAAASVLSRIRLYQALGGCADLVARGFVVPPTAAYDVDRRVWACVGGIDIGRTGNNGGDRAFVVKTDLSSGPSFTHAMMVVALPAPPALEAPPGSCEPLGGLGCSSDGGAWDRMLRHYHANIAAGCGANVVVQGVVPCARWVYKVYVVGAFVHIHRIFNGTFMDRAAEVVAKQPLSSGSADENGNDLPAHWVLNSQDKVLFPAPLEGAASAPRGDADARNGSADSDGCTTDDDDALLLAALHAAVGDVVPILQHHILGFGLFGMDVVAVHHGGGGDACGLGVAAPQCVGATNFAILDINYFPSFRGVPDAQEKLLSYIEARVRQCDDSNTHHHS